MAATTPSFALPTGTWAVDPARSRVAFQAKHLGIAPVRGAFAEVDGTLELADDPAACAIRGSATVASLDTGQPRRDTHLRSADFFDAERFPTLTFASTAVRALGAGTLEVVGDLTVHGVTQPLTLDVEIREAGDDRLVLGARGRVRRSDFGMTSVRVFVSDRVDVELEVCAVRTL